MITRLSRALKFRGALYMWPTYANNPLKRPIVSLSFDDFPKSAAEAGWTILSDFGVKATYYFCADFAGRTVDGVRQYDTEDLARLHALGHEIGCHTASHPVVPTLRLAELDLELERNAAFLREAGVAAPMRTFAYPYGRVGPLTKRHLAGRFKACRSVYPRTHRAEVDLALLRCVSLEPHVLAARPLDAWLDDVLREKSWLILLTHDVDERPSAYGIRPDELVDVLRGVCARGIETATIADTVDELLASRPPEGEGAIRHGTA